jgi:4'-phosphopantetheinyl transferase
VDRRADTRLHLDPGEVHLWHRGLRNNEDALRLEPTLSRDEIERANRFRFPEHRRRFVIARGTLRRLVSNYLSITPEKVAFQYQESGKPELAPGHRSELHFNVSHSEDLAAFSFVLSRPIGVDVEMVRCDVDVHGIPQRFFSTAEQDALARLTGPHKFRGFFNCWTRKEAYVKAVGSGLSLPLRDFDVSLLPGEPARLLATRPDAQMAGRWTMQALDFGEEFAGAVVVEGAITKLKVLNYTCEQPAAK